MDANIEDVSYPECLITLLPADCLMFLELESVTRDDMRKHIILLCLGV